MHWRQKRTKTGSGKVPTCAIQNTNVLLRLSRGGADATVVGNLTWSQAIYGRVLPSRGEITCELDHENQVYVGRIWIGISHRLRLSKNDQALEKRRNIKGEWVFIGKKTDVSVEPV